MALKYNMEGMVFQVWKLANGIKMSPDEYVFRHLVDAEKRKAELERLTGQTYKITSTPFISEILETDEYEW